MTIFFENPHYLYLAWIIPVLIVVCFFSYRRHLNGIQKLGEKKLIDNLIKGPSGYLYFFKFMLLLLVFAALVIALAGPQLPGKNSGEVEPAKKEVVFVLDISNSMMVTDDVPTRLQKAKNFMQQVVNTFNGEQVGMVLFAGKASAYLPFTGDYDLVNSSIKAISNKMALQQGTSLREALDIAGLYFNKQNDKVKVMCVLSDGESHTGNFEKTADSLRKTGINIFAIGAGSKAGGQIVTANADGTQAVKLNKNGAAVISQLHEENLLKITGGKAGRYFSLKNKEMTVAAFSSELKKLPDNTLSDHGGMEKYFRFFLLIALFFLLLDLVLT